MISLTITTNFRAGPNTSVLIARALNDGVVSSESSRYFQGYNPGNNASIEKLIEIISEWSRICVTH